MSNDVICKHGIGPDAMGVGGRTLRATCGLCGCAVEAPRVLGCGPVSEDARQGSSRVKQAQAPMSLWFAMDLISRFFFASVEFLGSEIGRQ